MVFSKNSNKFFRHYSPSWDDVGCLNEACFFNCSRFDAFRQLERFLQPRLHGFSFSANLQPSITLEPRNVWHREGLLPGRDLFRYCTKVNAYNQNQWWAFTVGWNFLYMFEHMSKLEHPNYVLPVPRSPCTNCDGHLLHGSSAKSWLLKSSGYVIQTRN